jgi:hypothetical protein
LRDWASGYGIWCIISAWNQRVFRAGRTMQPGSGGSSRAGNRFTFLPMTEDHQRGKNTAGRVEEQWLLCYFLVRNLLGGKSN